jgi:hypothetical protein
MLEDAHLQLVVRIQEHRKARRAGDRLGEQAEPLCKDVAPLRRQPSDVAARPAEVGGKPRSQRIAGDQHDGNGARHLGGRGSVRRARRHYNGHALTGQLGCRARQLLRALPTAIGDREVLAVGIPVVTQALDERLERWLRPIWRARS